MKFRALNGPIPSSQQPARWPDGPLFPSREKILGSPRRAPAFWSWAFHVGSSRQLGQLDWTRGEEWRRGEGRGEGVGRARKVEVKLKPKVEGEGQVNMKGKGDACGAKNENYKKKK